MPRKRISERGFADGSVTSAKLAASSLDAPTFTGTVSVSGGQITFPAVPLLSSGANTLDDYEEGTWTVIIRATTTNPTATYDTPNYGTYVKIGKTVFITGTLALATLSAAGSGTIFIPGMPFAASTATDGGFGSFSLGYRGSWATTTPAIMATSPALSRLYLYSDASVLLTAANLTGSSYIQFSGFYTTGS